MGQFAERPWDEHRELVDQVHQSLPAEVENTAFVSSDELNHRGDKVHFDSASYRELGRRYAAAYAELYSPKSKTEPRRLLRRMRSLKLGPKR